MGNSQARSLDDIVARLRDANWTARQRACESLSRLPADEIVKLKDHIVPVLKDTDWFVRLSACAILRKLPADEIVKLKDHIVPLLKDTDWSVRESACVTLGKLPADEIVKLKDHIVPLLKDTDWHVRESACVTLGKLPADEIVKLKDHIVPLLKDTDWHVRKSACVFLGKLPADEIVKLKDHIFPLLNATYGGVRAHACQTLGKLPADEIVKLKDHFVPLLNDTSEDVRSNACVTLGKLPADELVKLIVPLLLRKEVRKGAFALFGQLEVTKDLISLVEKLRPAFLLHFAAAAGDWPACSLLLRSGFSAEEKDSDGRTPSEIARREGHLDLAERLKSDSLNTKGGSGMAIARALQDDNQIEAVSWYTMPLSGWAHQFGGQHSLLVVKVKDFAYAIERARSVQYDLVSQKLEIKQATKKGLFVSDWEEVRTVPHLVRLETVAPLQGSDVKRSISPKSLVTYLFSFDGYDVGRNNCHHTAMEAFNFCTDRLQLTSLPINLWQSFFAKGFQFLGSDLANGRSASGACASEPLYNGIIRHPLITGSKPTEWSSDGQKKEHLREIDAGSTQCQKVKDFVMKFGGNETEIPGFKIEKIYRNENFGSYKKYVQHLEDKTAQHEYCWLFHGPGGQAGFDKIVTEGRGFDDDFRSMTFAAYGQGHYFALDFRLADFFAEGKSQHDPKKTRRVFLCRVAAGKPFDAERLFPYVPDKPKSGRTNEEWTEKMEEFNKSKPEGHDNSWIGDDRALIVGKGEMVYVDYIVEYTSTKLAGNPYVDPLMKEIRKIPRPGF